LPFFTTATARSSPRRNAELHVARKQYRIVFSARSPASVHIRSATANRCTANARAAGPHAGTISIMPSSFERQATLFFARFTRPRMPPSSPYPMTRIITAPVVPVSPVPSGSVVAALPVWARNPSTQVSAAMMHTARTILDERVRHPGAEVPLHGQGRLEVVLQLGERVFEAAGLLADGDEFEEQRREPVPVRIQRVFERVAALQFLGDLLGDRPQRPRAGLPLELEDPHRAEPRREAVPQRLAPGDESGERELA
jgi:hypothetical protein